ncbi:hypothetical protein HZC27_04705 [Candidatus Roizmanbacteria bacterium]|nr:hypothetical protein [Candidatus Roizmanbacteria bacterium]
MLSSIRKPTDGWGINMKKSNVTTIFLLVMTFGLVGAIAYFSTLLSNKSGTSVTQIKKTKASAQTYHKLFALDSPSGGGTIVPTAAPSTAVLPTQRPSVVPSAAPTLLAQNNITPTVAPSPTIIPTVVSTIAPTPTSIPQTPTAVPSPTIPLLAYRTTTITPTLIPVANTGGEQTKVSPTVTVSPTKAPTVTKLPDNKLPETGWVQLSTILFIVATITVFVSFLF